MPATHDSTRGFTDDDAAQRLAHALSEAVSNRANGNGVANGGRSIGGRYEREAAVEIGAAMLAEASIGTAEHSDDVVLISEAIGERMGISGADADDLLAAARLHDIGKVWIPSELLEKPGPLSDEEWRLMHQHTLVGERILTSVPELGDVARLVKHSHERWDGAGYPDGLAGAEIPLGSRIIFCADAFHAIRCDRPYRRGRSASQAVAEIKRCAGTQFDPEVAITIEQVVRERRRRPPGRGGSPRLLALLMCLVVGGAGTALARTGLSAESDAGTPAGAADHSVPAGCGTAACPSVAGPVGGLGPVGALTGETGARPLFPGLPGQLHRHSAPGKVRGKSAQAHFLHKGQRGKSAEAKARHAAKARGAGHSNGAGNSTGSHGAGAGQGVSSASSTASSGGSGHGSGSGHHSARRGSSRGRGGSRSHSGAGATNGRSQDSGSHGP